jgi:hypothetical protein
MTKPAKVSDDKLVMAVRAILKSVEPRKLPTEMAKNDWGHDCWVCPYCGELLRRHDRSVRHRYGYERKVDYSAFNMHFGAMHATPFWKEQQIIKAVLEAQK